jgi:hypothetical protein
MASVISHEAHKADPEAVYTFRTCYPNPETSDLACRVDAFVPDDLLDAVIDLRAESNSRKHFMKSRSRRPIVARLMAILVEIVQNGLMMMNFYSDFRPPKSDFAY